MKRMILCRVTFIAALCQQGIVLPAQTASFDSSYILPFSKNNTIEIYSGVYNIRFDFLSPGGGFGARHNNFRLAANSSAYVGSYFNYKWLSLNYSTAMPGTRLDKTVKLQITSFRFRFGTKQMRFHPFYDNYNGLLIVKKRGRYEAFKTIRFIDAGLDYYYFTNTKKFSYSTANFFSENQLKSAGSLFFSAKPMWQKITWKNPSHNLIGDSATYTLLAENPEWVMCTISSGYSYNFSFSNGKWMICPTAMIGGGFLRELNTSPGKLQPASVIQAWVNTGYNGQQYYVYLNAEWDDLKTNLKIKNIHQVNTVLSITAGYRFGNAGKRISGLL